MEMISPINVASPTSEQLDEPKGDDKKSSSAENSCSGSPESEEEEHEEEQEEEQEEEMPQTQEEEMPQTDQPSAAHRAAQGLIDRMALLRLQAEAEAKEEEKKNGDDKEWVIDVFKVIKSFKHV